MTKEETIDRIKVMQGYVDGKQIQFYDEGMRCWCDITDPLWDSVAKYRIKPEKRVRPYKNAEEFLQAQKEHGMYVCEHENVEGHKYVYYWMPTYVADTCTEINGCRLDYEDFWEQSGNSTYSWQDGTSLGIEEE